MKTLKLMNALVVRPRMLVALAAGLAAGGGAWLLGPHLRLSTILITGWDVFAAAFVLLMLSIMFGARSAEIRTRAARDDEGRATILALVLLACGAAIAGTGMELHLAREMTGWGRALYVGLAVATVVVAWMLVQMVFAIHYAHGFYTQDDAGKGDRGGLLFPGKAAPDYWDFVHFAVVIGVASQTADVQFTSKRMRRLGTVHSLVAFAFNTVIVALTINLLAGLF